MKRVVSLFVFALFACPPSPANTPPVFGDAELTVAEGERASVTLTATDVDGDAITFTLITAPSFVSLEEATLTATPGYSDEGDAIVTVRASDGTDSTTATITVHVTNTNRPPVLTPPAAQELETGVPSSLTLSAVDPDGDALSFALSGAPAWVSLTEATIVFAPAVPGTFEFQATVSDGEAEDSASVTVVVTQHPITGTLSIANGAAWTRMSTVALSLSATSSVGTVTEVAFSNDGTAFGAAEPFATTWSGYMLVSGDGAKTVTARLRDSAGNERLVADSITLDGTPPDVAFSINGGAATTNSEQVTLGIGATDETSGVALVEASNDGVDFVPVTGATPSWSLTPGFGGKTVTLRVTDNAGNVATRSAAITRTAALSVVSTTPADGETGVSRSSVISVTFSSALAPSLVNSSNFVISGAIVPGSWAWNAEAGAAVFTPSGVLPAGIQLTVTITNVLATAYTFSFTTGSALTISGQTAGTIAAVSATSATGSMIIDASVDSKAAPAWAFRSGATGQWSSGLLIGAYAGAGALVAWGDRFVYVYSATFDDAPSSRVWFIFENGAWTRQTAEAPMSGSALAGGATTLLEGRTTAFSPYKIEARFFDGSSWTPWVTLDTGTTVAAASVASNGTDFAIAYSVVLSAGPVYGARVIRFAGGAWTPTVTLAGTMTSYSPAEVYSRGTTFVARLAYGSALSSFNTETGNWVATWPCQSLAFTSVYDGDLVAACNTGGTETASVRRFNGTSWSTLQSFPASQSFIGFDANAGSIAGGMFNYNTHTPVAVFFDGASWQSEAGLVFPGESPVGILPVVLNAGRALLPYTRAGRVHALVYDSGAWTSLTELDSGDYNGGLLGIRAGAGFALHYGQGTHIDVRELGGIGTTFAAQSPVVSMNGSGQAQDSRVAMNANGTGLAVWQQREAGAWSVMGAGFQGGSWGAPLRIARAASVPQVASNGTNFVVTWLSAEPRARWAAAWSPVSGLSTPVRLDPSLITEFADTAAMVASDGATYVTAFSRKATSSGDPAAYYAVSSDGVTWSSPGPFGVSGSEVQVAGGAAGFLLGAGSASNYSVRIIAGGSIGTAQTFASASRCGLAVGTTTFGAACAATFVPVRIHASGSWGTATNNGGTCTTPVLAASGDVFRVACGSVTNTWATGAWGSGQSITSMELRSLIAEGAEFAGVGSRVVSGYDSVSAFRSTAGVMAELPLLETWNTAASSQQAGWSGTQSWAVWTQDDRIYASPL